VDPSPGATVAPISQAVHLSSTSMATRWDISSRTTATDLEAVSAVAVVPSKKSPRRKSVLEAE
jgi:hypothetical protein